MNDIQKFLDNRAKARAKLLEARKAFLAARAVCAAAGKEYAKYVIPKPKATKAKAPKPAKKGRRR